MAPRTQPPAAPAYAYADPPRMSLGGAQPGYTDTKGYASQPATSQYTGSAYSTSTPGSGQYPDSHSDYAGQYATQAPAPHNMADQYGSPTTAKYASYDNKYPLQQQPAYNGYPSQEADAGAYHRVAQPGPGYIDQTNGRYTSSTAPRDSVQTSETGSSSYSADGNRGISSYQQQYTGADPIHSSAKYQQLPLPTDTGEDFSIDVGDMLKRSASTASSFASAGSLLQEPKHSPTLDRNILTPTATPTSLRNPAPYGNAAPTSNTNPYGGRDYYSSPTSGYGTPAIVTTPAEQVPGGSSNRRARGQEYHRMASMKGPLQMHEDEEDEEEDELEEDRFVNLSLLSHLANRLRDRVPRGTHVKGSIPYPTAFTGKDIVVCYNPLPHQMPNNSSIPVYYPSTGSKRISEQYGLSNK